MTTDHFGDDVAPHYDALGGAMFADDVLGPTVDRLAALAAGGPALELAVGTGRVALPLAARGVPVTGIELSPAMVRELRAKDPSETVPVVIGDMTEAVVPGGLGTFRLVYLVYNTIGNLLTQDAQVRCFANAAAHLAPGGSFVIEVGVPELRRLVPGSDALVFTHRPGYVGYDRYIDLTQQVAMSHHFHADADGDVVREFRTPFRYVWPSELDLMARLAGMELAARWADWNGAEFTGDSPSHVSVWSPRV